MDRGSDRLVITFDNLAEAGGRHYDRDAWAAKYIAENGWNHMGVMAAGPTWFRDEKLIAFLDGLKSDGFLQILHMYPRRDRPWVALAH